MNNHEHLDEGQAKRSENADSQVEQMEFESELAEQQRRRLYYRESGQLGPGTY